MKNCAFVIDEYIKWIKDNTSIRSVSDGNSCNIITPFLNNHNDHIEIYICKNRDKMFLSDDGFTISDLNMSGVSLSSPKRDKIFQSILNGFGIKRGKNDELYVEVSPSNVGQKKHYLLQAILAVNDMYTLSQENITSLFKEDVETYFNANDIIHSKDIKLGGKTGFDHNIDFLIPKTKRNHERLIRTLNRPKKDNILATIFSFKDIAEIRQQESENFVIYNDIESKLSQESTEALTKYDIQYIPWSKKEECLEKLSLA